MSIGASLYIPRMSVDHTEESVAYYMREHRIGTVSHVDFTPIHQKPGFTEIIGQVVKSAFVHFSDPWLCTDQQYHFPSIYQKNPNDTPCRFWNNIASGQHCKITISSDEFWLCFKNKNPVQRTMMNVHQIVENGRYLEGIVEAQAKHINQQNEKLELLEAKLQNVTTQMDNMCKKLLTAQHNMVGYKQHAIEKLMVELVEDEDDQMRELLKRMVTAYCKEQICIKDTYENITHKQWSNTTDEEDV